MSYKEARTGLLAIAWQLSVNHASLKPTESAVSVPYAGDVSYEEARFRAYAELQQGKSAQVVDQEWQVGMQDKAQELQQLYQVRGEGGGGEGTYIKGGGCGVGKEKRGGGGDRGPPPPALFSPPTKGCMR